jgi:hypothetical protein
MRDAAVAFGFADVTFGSLKRPNFVADVTFGSLRWLLAAG